MAKKSKCMTSVNLFDYVDLFLVSLGRLFLGLQGFQFKSRLDLTKERSESVEF